MVNAGFSPPHRGVEFPLVPQQCKRVAPAVPVEVILADVPGNEPKIDVPVESDLIRAVVRCAVDPRLGRLPLRVDRTDHPQRQYGAERKER